MFLSNHRSEPLPDAQTFLERGLGAELLERQQELIPESSGTMVAKHLLSECLESQGCNCRETTPR